MWRALQTTTLVLAMVLTVNAAISTGAAGEQELPLSLADLFSGRDDPAAMTPRDRRDPGGDRWTLGLGKRAAHYSPYVSVGALSNMQQFFDSLKSNLEGFDSLPQEEKQALLGQALEMAVPSRWAALRYPTTPRGICGGKPCWQVFSRFSRFPHVYRLTRDTDAYISHINSEQDKTFRPRATAAYLHALRNHRPSYKIRNFVEESDAANLRGANNYDPNLLWAGLGKRR